MSFYFMPHRYCLGGYGYVLWLHVIFDLFIFLSYVAISLGLFYFIKQRGDAPFGYIFRFFGLFILACAFTHLMGIIVQWWPNYWLDAFIKGICAIISIISAFVVFVFMPIAIKVNDIIWTSKDEGRLFELKRMIELFEEKLLFARRKQ